MAEVVLRDVCKRYGNYNAVDNVNLTIRDKEFVVLVGPSGCGKSTTLRMIAGLEEISGGTIAIGDQIVNDLPPRERDIAMVFQNYALYQHMTVYDNLAFGLRNRKVPEDTIKAEIDRAVDILGLRDLLKRKPRELSGGQQQRVALGRCIVRHAKVFLFDEPLSNLDAKLRAHMRLELKRLHRRVETTAVYVTHDQVEAMTLGDRVVVMNNSRIEQVGTPWEIYAHPRTRFVASFIGSPAMNFLDGKVRRNGSGFYVQAPGGTFHVSDQGSSELAAHDGGEIIVGLRPEHISLSETRTENALHGRVELTEQLGAEQLVEVIAEGAKIMVSRVDAERELKPGTPVYLTVEPGQLRYFDRITEERLV
ncbi:sn-glycerol-3-phosphate ABC transporter ATP-binding protein UgpC [Pseudaminobacter arsenicus]|uniref:sn-glycerol-3-phosphate ABC transporter ATP-binding protein UgpC n=1 Tax=Borborobacter arsenicus TaxID=1851146 RepID=A0A432V3G7_9HYPH|nr:sn-glycerol-3-phosphate ABC transporter ATP-binding protein UgpC [Pseudaminobacter arsenicus]RUM96665.1 sn-glycerol-3-phosphate ABC transporter ATP-binding protein UgpC [Pseudaminobacter arsenicus]